MQFFLKKAIDKKKLANYTIIHQGMLCKLDQLRIILKFVDDNSIVLSNVEIYIQPWPKKTDQQLLGIRAIDAFCLLFFFPPWLWY